MDTIAATNIVAILILTSILNYYSLSMTSPYPRVVIENFQYPHVRLLTYFALYCLSYVNPIVALLAFMIVTFLYLDYINLART